MIRSEKVVYQDKVQSYQGIVAYDTEWSDRRPVILISHAWGGQSAFEEQKAISLAELGYVAFAIDLYGQGKRGKTPEECRQLMNYLNADRPLLLERIRHSISIAKTLPKVNPNKIGAIGFCFGGKCVLDLARSGDQYSGVVSFHGLLDAPQDSVAEINTPILILHGWDDPMAKPNDVTTLTSELSSKNADWELVAYGHTAHSFTNPKANSPEKGTVYNADAYYKSWNRMVQFFKDRFE